MKLRNKKTGEIVYATLMASYGGGELQIRYYPVNDAGSTHFKEYRSISEFSKEWEDYEEPKEYWYIDWTPEIEVYHTRDVDSDGDKRQKEIGNYFETKEEAEKALEKLKAWHKLVDYWGTEILGWEIRDMPTGGNWQTVNVKLNVKTRKEPMELLDLLFSGEDGDV